MVCSGANQFRRRFGERSLARENFIEDQPQRINVAAGGYFSPPQLFGRHVGWGAAANLRPADVIGHSRQAKVGDHHLASSIEHDIGRLQVAMENALGVGRGQSRAEMACNVERFVGREPADAPQQRSQIFAVDVFHGEKCLALDLAHVIHSANVGMRNSPCHAHFVAKAFEQCLIASGIVRQKLHRHRLAER